jgi:hypothetical protein
MGSIQDIRTWLKTNFPLLQDYVQVMDNPNQLVVHERIHAIIVVHAMWSGPSIVTTLKTIEELIGEKHEGEILVIDIDCLSTAFQLETFGQICHGQGEVFQVRNGVVKAFGASMR